MSENKSLFKLSWKEYYEKLVNADKYQSIDQRILLLSETRKWFEKYAQFSKLDYDKRSAVAGFYFRQIDGILPVPDWTWFGSMKGAGHFKSTVKNNNEYLSFALDAIPLSGPVTKNDFDNFRDNFFKSFSYTNPIAVATRLLCIKRPDYFVCINNGNRNTLCDVFNTKKSIDLEGYWNNIILKIMDMPWWNSEPPLNRNELAVHKARTAFLDAIYYVSLSSYESSEGNTVASVENQYEDADYENAADEEPDKVSGHDVTTDTIIQKSPFPEMAVTHSDSHERREPPLLYPPVNTEQPHNLNKTDRSIISRPAVSKNNESIVLNEQDRTETLNPRKRSDIKRCVVCKSNLYGVVKYCPYCSYEIIQSVASSEKTGVIAEKNVCTQYDEKHEDLHEPYVNKFESDECRHSSCDTSTRKKGSRMSGLIKWFFVISVVILAGSGLIIFMKS